jgi:hypothetical protein
MGCHERAIAIGERAVAHSRAQESQPGLSNALVFLGEAVARAGDDERASAYYRESLAIAAEAGDRMTTLKALIRLIGVDVVHRQPRAAARLLGFVDAQRERFTSPVPPRHQAMIEGAAASARAALGEDAFAAAWTEGRAMSLAEAGAEALAVGADPAESSSPPSWALPASRFAPS